MSRIGVTVNSFDKEKSEEKFCEEMLSASNCQFYKFSDRNFPGRPFSFLDLKMQLKSHAKKSLRMVFILCWEFMEKFFLYNFEEKLNKLSLLCHVEKEEGKVVLRENSQLVDQLEPAAWRWISRCPRLCPPPYTYPSY